MGWEVDEVVPITCIIMKPLGATSTFAYIALLCYARRRGLGLSEFFMTEVRLLIDGST